MIYTGKLITAEDAYALNIIHGIGNKEQIEEVAWQQLLPFRDLAPTAFAEAKRMRTGRFYADVREQISSRVARQVEIWNGSEAQAP